MNFYFNYHNGIYTSCKHLFLLEGNKPYSLALLTVNYGIHLNISAIQYLVPKYMSLLNENELKQSSTINWG